MTRLAKTNQSDYIRRLAIEIEKTPMQLSEIAFRADLTESSIRRWFGTSDPGLHNYLAVLRVFGLTLMIVPIRDKGP